jgi:hypothetical protein
MATGNLTLAANVSGGPDGGRTFGPVTITSQASVAAVTTVALVVGDNTITVPTGATVCVLYPPNASIPIPNPSFGGTLKLKGAGGDTGIVISAKWVTELAWDSPPGSFIVNSTGTGNLVAWFM